MNFDNTTAAGQWGYHVLDVPGGVRRHRGHHRLRGDGRANEVLGYILYSFIISLLHLPGVRALGLGEPAQQPTTRTSALWLANMGFIDFAGSTVVHSVGGWAALAGAIVLGPRIGKFTKDGKARAIPGHSLTLAALGVFILFVGLVRIQPRLDNHGRRHHFAYRRQHVPGRLRRRPWRDDTAWIKFGKPDIGMTLNGCLAGLVAITARAPP